MLTLKELAVRHPDLYIESNCIVCKEEKEEDQDHLAVCPSYERFWLKAKSLVITTA